MSRKIDHKIWENPPHLFGRQPGIRLVRLRQDVTGRFLASGAGHQPLLRTIEASYHGSRDQEEVDF